MRHHRETYDEVRSGVKRTAEKTEVPNLCS